MFDVRKSSICILYNINSKVYKFKYKVNTTVIISTAYSYNNMQ